MFLGVPHDAGVTYQPGARLAPYHVRRVSALVTGWHPLHELDPFAALRAIDGGNVVFPPFDRAAMRHATQDTVGEVLAAGAVPMLCGGDHSVALPAWRAAAAAHGPLAMIHVDAHLDTSGPETWGDEFHHGTPLRHALAEGLLAPGALCSVGIRGPWSSPDDGALARRHDARIVSPDELTARGPATVAAELRERCAGRPVWLTVDVDGIDPAYAPGTGTPVPGGLTAREALALLRALAGLRVVGMDVVEVAPALDHADLTCHLAAHLLFEGLALAAVARARGA